MRRGRAAHLALTCALFFILSTTTTADPPQRLDASRVLVVYNSAATGAQDVLNTYLAAHPDITQNQVLNLNSTALVGANGISKADISYSDFITYIRNPIRSFLQQTDHPSANDILCVCLIYGIPHRIMDMSTPTIGDDPNSQLNQYYGFNATSASVDSELTLLWQNLEQGEAGGSADSYADNCIVNPYYGQTVSIASFNRSNLMTQKSFSMEGGYWGLSGTNATQFTSGDMVLVSRIDGKNVTDAKAIISRAANLRVNRKYVWVVIDKDATNNYSGVGSNDDYKNAKNHLVAANWNVMYDESATFISGTLFHKPVISIVSYGTNHNPAPNPRGYISSFKFARGAIFNTMESYNGRAFNGLGAMFSQEQIANFIAAGGTFGIGNVWEPFAGLVAKSDPLTSGMLINNMTWAEAAWSSIPGLSWQNIVVGDPLARMQIIDQPADFDSDGMVGTSDINFVISCFTGPGMGPVSDDCSPADLNNDGAVDMEDFAILQRCIAADPGLANPNCAN